jgi:hypothetical protein
MWSATFETDLNAIIYVRDLIFPLLKDSKMSAPKNKWTRAGSWLLGLC